jgi:hypothetical protein
VKVSELIGLLVQSMADHGDSAVMLSISEGSERSSEISEVHAVGGWFVFLRDVPTERVES